MQQHWQFVEQPAKIHQLVQVDMHFVIRQASTIRVLY
jgi:hypothetical protein